MEEIENDNIKMWMQDGIMHGIYKKGAIIGLKQAKEIVSDRKILTKGELVKGVIYLTHIVSISAEARKYFATDEATEGYEKMALITTSVMAKVLGNAFLKFEKPKVPTKIFSTEGEAKKWLLGN